MTNVRDAILDYQSNPCVGTARKLWNILKDNATALSSVEGWEEYPGYPNLTGDVAHKVICSTFNHTASDESPVLAVVPFYAWKDGCYMIDNNAYYLHVKIN